MSTTQITLLRHGLPEGDQCFRGHTDFLLTEEGFEQMHKSIQNIEQIDCVVTSPLKRCADFSYDFANPKSIPVFEQKNWMELNFGDWDGKRKDDVWKNDQQTLSLFWSDPWNITPPNGETLHAYDKRIYAAWQQLLSEHQSKHVLLVTHGGVIKQLFRQVFNMPKSEQYLHRLNIPYAARITISVYHDENGKVWPELQWPSP